MNPSARLAGLAAALLLFFSTAFSGTHDSGTPIMSDGSSPQDEAPRQPQENPGVQLFHLDDVRGDREAHGRPWQEFLRVPELFAGIYELPAGSTDPQGPHDADEVYHVLTGAGTLMVEEEPYPVRAGSVVYVAKELDHRFVDITEDLSVLVFFATPPGSG